MVGSGSAHSAGVDLPTPHESMPIRSYCARTVADSLGAT